MAGGSPRDVLARHPDLLAAICILFIYFYFSNHVSKWHVSMMKESKFDLGFINLFSSSLTLLMFLKLVLRLKNSQKRL